MIRMWSKKGELLIEIKGHESTVTSLCWSKDSARIFSASSDCTIRAWQSLNGKELAVLRGHTKAVTSLCLSPNECYLVSASRDCSVRIWNLKTNKPVGELFHDGELLALAMSPDGKYVASAQLYAKVYVWSLEAALKQGVGSAHDGNGEPDTKPKISAAPSRDIFDTHLVSGRRANNRGTTKYGNDFWGDNTDRAPPRSAPPARSSSPFRWRNLFGFLRFSTRPADAPQPISLQPRRWNFTLLPVTISRHPVVVSPARDDDRIGIAPPSEAEVAAAMERTYDNKANSSTQQSQAAAGAQGSQFLMQGPTQTTQGQNSVAGTEELSYEVRCCGFPLFAVGAHRTSH
ncbi:WD40-repeat-containing domain protein [Suillus ampliporus]|nr:WD40-repeat-containing domain protein [Suillus ampliporus]